MITKKDLENEIESLKGLNDMVDVYEEVAAVRIKHSRDSVLHDRIFISELSEIFNEVVFSYKKQVEALMKAKKIKNPAEFSFLDKNGKTLYVLISANTGLYGNIIKRTFDLFVENSKNTACDKLIIGKVGQGMWEVLGTKEKYYYFDFPDQNVDNEVLKKILNFLLAYKKVVVFYGQFQNLVKQDPTFSDVSGNSYVEKPLASEKVRYFFEPSLSKILEFFEKQIFSSIFGQSVRESQLAKIASRLTTLDSASENIYKKLMDSTFQKNVSKHHEQNKKQLETFASKILWERT